MWIEATPFLVEESDDEVQETQVDAENSPTPSCMADPTWQDAQGSPVLSPASSAPSLTSNGSGRAVMTAAKTQPPKPRETESAELQAMKDQYAALQAQMVAMNELMKKQGLSVPPCTPQQKQVFSPQLPPAAMPSDKQECPAVSKAPPPKAAPLASAESMASTPKAAPPASAPAVVASPLAPSEPSETPSHTELAPGEEWLAETFDLSAEDSCFLFIFFRSCWLIAMFHIARAGAFPSRIIYAIKEALW